MEKSEKSLVANQAVEILSDLLRKDPEACAKLLNSKVVLNKDASALPHFPRNGKADAKKLSAGTLEQRVGEKPLATKSSTVVDGDHILGFNAFEIPKKN